MPYDLASTVRLSAVCPVLRRKVTSAMDALAKENTYFRVAQGLRTYGEQQALYAQGRTTPGKIVTNARGGYSNHNFGMAVDCYPFLSGDMGEINWNAQTPQFVEMVQTLKAQGLAWGGDWKSLTDFPHFQLANVPVTPTDQDRALFAQGGLAAVWKFYGVDQ